MADMSLGYSITLNMTEGNICNRKEDEGRGEKRGEKSSLRMTTEFIQVSNYLFLSSIYKNVTTFVPIVGPI